MVQALDQSWVDARRMRDPSGSRSGLKDRLALQVVCRNPDQDKSARAKMGNFAEACRIWYK